jgi:hypothetical protein
MRARQMLQNLYLEQLKAAILADDSECIAEILQDLTALNSQNTEGPIQELLQICQEIGSVFQNTK